MQQRDQDATAFELPPFHLAIPVSDLEAARAFYVGLFGCRVGRESERWIDFDFFGHQLTVHQVPGGAPPPPSNPVDGKQVPIPHFGAVLAWDVWHALAERLAQASVTFIIEPYVRFAGQVGEQATMFLADPSGNHIELKSFKDRAGLFQR